MTRFFPDYGQEPPGFEDPEPVEPYSVPSQGQRVSLRTPAEVRAAIQTNPSDPVLRTYIMQRAVELNMSEEIPEDWTYTLDSRFPAVPRENLYRESYMGMAPDVVAQSSLFTPEYNNDEAVILRAYPDSIQIVIATVVGQKPFTEKFTPDVAQEIIVVIREIVRFNVEDLIYAIAARGPDPTNGMWGWVDIRGQFYLGWDIGEGENTQRNPELRVVFYNPSNRLRFTLDAYHHGFTDPYELIDDLNRLIDDANEAYDRRNEMPERGQR